MPKNKSGNSRAEKPEEPTDVIPVVEPVSTPLPKLKYQPGSTADHFVEYSERLKEACYMRFGYLGHIVAKGQYYTPPAIPIPTVQEVEANPFAKDLYMEAYRERRKIIASMEEKKLGCYQLIWSTLSTAKLRQRPDFVTKVEHDMAEIIPTTVTNLIATNLDENDNHAASTVTLSWSYDIDNSTPLLGYIIAYLDTSDEMHSVYVNDVSEAPAHIISDLQNGVSYEFSVFGINMLGAGPSLSVTAILPPVPDAPEVTISHGHNSIQLDWFDLYDESNDIKGYKIYRALASLNAGVSTYVDSALTNGSYYKYEINDNGEGPRSATVVEYPSTVPSAPTNVNLVNRQGQGVGGALTLGWTQPPLNVNTNGGSPLIQFDITDGDFNLVGSVMAVVGQANYSMPISNLINGQIYAFSVCAVNRDGAGADSLSLDAIPSGLPDIPFGLAAGNSNFDGGGQQAFQSFEPLNVATGGANVHPSDEGSGITRYNYYRDGVLVNWTGNSQTSVFDNGLANGQLYPYTVSAGNANGEGAQCAPVPFISSSAPDALTNIAVSHGNQRATIT